jgi:hypothetical protein
MLGTTGPARLKAWQHRPAAARPEVPALVDPLAPFEGGAGGLAAVRSDGSENGGSEKKSKRTDLPHLPRAVF